MNATEVREAVQNLPALPVVTAQSSFYAQAWNPTKADRAAIRARQDFFAAMEMPILVNVTVLDFDGRQCGTLGFHHRVTV